MSEPDLSGPVPAAITQYIVDAFPVVDIVTAGGGTFFSIDSEKHWPNFATLVTTDEYDDRSNLSRPGVFRLNIGVSRATFDRLLESRTADDYAVLDRLLPHPEYARQHWVAILNPSVASFDEIVKPLLHEAYDRLAEVRARHQRTS